MTAITLDDPGYVTFNFRVGDAEAGSVSTISVDVFQVFDRLVEIDKKHGRGVGDKAADERSDFLGDVAALILELGGPLVTIRGAAAFYNAIVSCEDTLKKKFESTPRSPTGLEDWIRANGPDGDGEPISRRFPDSTPSGESNSASPTDSTERASSALLHEVRDGQPLM